MGKESRPLFLGLLAAAMVVGGCARAPRARQAKVTGVDRCLGLVVLSVGQRHGVRKGDMFVVSRGGRYIGKAVVNDVFPDICASLHVDHKFRTIERGDDATLWRPRRVHQR